MSPKTTGLPKGHKTLEPGTPTPSVRGRPNQHLPLGGFNRLVAGLAMTFAVIAAASALILMTAVIADVIARGLTGGSLPGMVDVAESMLVVMTFLGLAHGERTGQQIRTTVVTERCPAAVAQVLRAISTLVYLVVVGWLAYASIWRAVESTAEREYRFGLIHWPLYPTRIVVAVGFVALTLVMVGRVVAAIVAWRGRDGGHPPSRTATIGGPGSGSAR